MLCIFYGDQNKNTTFDIQTLRHQSTQIPEKKLLGGQLQPVKMLMYAFLIIFMPNTVESAKQIWDLFCLVFKVRILQYIFN